MAVTPSGEAAVSAATDGSARLWRLPLAPFEAGPLEAAAHAVVEFQASGALRGVDHHWSADKFATAGEQARALQSPVDMDYGHLAYAS